MCVQPACVSAVSSVLLKLRLSSGSKLLGWFSKTNKQDCSELQVLIRTSPRPAGTGTSLWPSSPESQSGAELVQGLRFLFENTDLTPIIKSRTRLVVLMVSELFSPEELKNLELLQDPVVLKVFVEPDSHERVLVPVADGSLEAAPPSCDLSQTWFWFWSRDTRRDKTRSLCRTGPAYRHHRFRKHTHHHTHTQTSSHKHTPSRTPLYTHTHLYTQIHHFSHTQEAQPEDLEGPFGRSEVRGQAWSQRGIQMFRPNKQLTLALFLDEGAGGGRSGFLCGWKHHQVMKEVRRNVNTFNTPLPRLQTQTLHLNHEAKMATS